MCGYVFYDFETMQCEIINNDNKIYKIHKVNYVVSHLVCDKCMNDTNDLDDPNIPIENKCSSCTYREFIAEGKNTVKQFVDFLWGIKNKYSEIIILAHNQKNYDGQWILKELINRKLESKINIIITGTSITVLSIENMKFIDSLNFFQAPLSALPRMFGLDEKIGKGYFPHFINDELHQNYIGPVPLPEMYGIRAKNKKELEKFNSWYKDRVDSGELFDFKKEIKHYCTLDVIVLRMACLKFINLTLKITNVNPFREALTCASLCMRVFQRNYLPKETIGIIPKNGYRLADNQSKEALQWLEWLAYSTASNIQHAGNSHEVRIGLKQIRVDGFNEGRKIIFQYHGCWWHGCIKCFIFNRNVIQKDGTTLEERYERTQNITKYLEEQGYAVVEKWGCEFKKLIKDVPQIKNFVDSIDANYFTALDPRDAYFGGRTENFVESYTVQPGETIQYLDFTSLYPAVLKMCAFPIGHPKVYVGRDIEKKYPNNDISQINGLIKCRVLAPPDLHMPVLPVRSKNKKLYFPLCRTCLDTMEKDFCNHNNSERSLIGTWVTSELKLALTKGYIVEKIFEVWHYEKMSMNNKETNETGLFTEYINTFLKIKQEASGYPLWVKTESDKDKYIQEYYEAENIKLDKKNIDHNPGLRTLSKNMLNSLYGKLGQRHSLWRKTICRDLDEYYSIVDNDKNIIQFIEPINQETVLISWKLIDEEASLTKTTNVVLAAFTTAYAREKLYSCIHENSKQILYVDTDSIIRICKNENDKLMTGSKLGDLTDELEEYGEGSYIKSFISGGPKFYSFIVQKPDGGEVEVCKLKGVRLDLEAQKNINFNSVKSLIKREIPPFEIKYDSIRRTKNFQVYSTIDKKMISVTGPKRNHYENITYPLGFKRQRT